MHILFFRSAYKYKRFALVVLLLLVYLVFSRCFIARNRIGDEKGKRWFAAKQATLFTYDTIIDKHRLHYTRCGNPGLPLLVFIHGSPGSWFHFMQFMYDTALLKKFNMVSADRPGFGHSEFGHPMHLQDQSALLLRLVQGLANGQAVYLAGHSMGGPVATQMAAMAPQQFKTIVLLAAAIDSKLEKPEIWRHVMGVQPLSLLLPGAFQPSNTELLWLKQDLPLLEPQLGRITCAVHFVHGDQDTWVPIENIAFGKRTMLHAASLTADTLRGADHQIPWKRREAVRDILLRLY